MCPAPCSCATEMKRMPASGKRSSASMYAEPTIPKTSFTPCATSVSTNASDDVIRCLPTTAIRAASVMVFICDSPETLHHQLGRGVLVAERLGDWLAGDASGGDVESVLQVRIRGERVFPAPV